MSLESWQVSGGFRWDHVYLDAGGRDWLAAQGLDRLVLEALTATDTRPRMTDHAGGTLVTLRGVNLMAGAEAEDMISTRMWLTADRAITVWLRPLRAMGGLIEQAQNGTPPASSGELVSRLALGLSETAAPVVTNLSERIDTLEEAMIDPNRAPDQDDLSDVRRVLIVLKRFLGPQRIAVDDLRAHGGAWLSKRDRQRLHEASDRTTRLFEELEALGLRGQVMQDHLEARRADHMNRQMYVLSVVAALFLPLGFVTGLLGINVAGMPGTEDGRAFWIVCGLLALLGLGQWWLFRAMGIVGRT